MRYGSDVVRHLRAKDVKTRIVMFSSSDDYNQMGIESGADATWSKDELRSPDYEKSFLEVVIPKPPYDLYIQSLRGYTATTLLPHILEAIQKKKEADGTRLTALLFTTGGYGHLTSEVPVALKLGKALCSKLAKAGYTASAEVKEEHHRGWNVGCTSSSVYMSVIWSCIK